MRPTQKLNQYVSAFLESSDTDIRNAVTINTRTDAIFLLVGRNITFR